MRQGMRNSQGLGRGRLSGPMRAIRLNSRSIHERSMRHRGVGKGAGQGADMLTDESLVVLINESVNAGKSARRRAAAILIEALRARDGHVALPPDQAYEVLDELR